MKKSELRQMIREAMGHSDPKIAKEYQAYHQLIFDFQKKLLNLQHLAKNTGERDIYIAISRLDDELDQLRDSIKHLRSGT